MAKTLKPDKPLRESLVSHRVITPEEEVRTIAGRVQTIVEGREVIFFSILVAIVLALGGSGVVWYLRSNESDLAREKLGQAYAGWRESAFPMGAPGAPAPAPAAPEVQMEKARAIEQVARDFPGTRPGAMASYLAGNAYVQAGSPARAIPLLHAALAGFDEKDPARPFTQRALAGALEDLGKADEALKAWTALMAGQSPAWKFEGLLGRGRILERQGRKSEAQAVYATVAAEFPDQARAMGLPVAAPTSPTSDLKVTTRPIQVEKK